jgi:hypothetical protein
VPDAAPLSPAFAEAEPSPPPHAASATDSASKADLFLMLFMDFFLLLMGPSLRAHRMHLAHRFVPRVEALCRKQPERFVGVHRSPLVGDEIANAFTLLAGLRVSSRNGRNARELRWANWSARAQEDCASYATWSSSAKPISISPRFFPGSRSGCCPPFRGRGKSSGALLTGRSHLRSAASFKSC